MIRPPSRSPTASTSCSSRGSIDPAKSRIERAVVYTFHSALATQWRRDRLLLAGDSAHQTPPFLGQGMCSGLRDAANLAWKLRDVITGEAPDSLLDTYETERMEHVRAFIELAVELGGVIQTTDRNGPVSATTNSSRTRPCCGRLHRGWVRACTATRRRRPARARRSRAWPTARGSMIASAIVSRCWRRAASSRRCRRACRDHGADGNLALVLADGEAADYLAGLGVEAVVIRPDRHILGVASTRPSLPRCWRVRP